jgi:hypothetical protein
MWLTRGNHECESLTASYGFKEEVSSQLLSSLSIAMVAFHACRKNPCMTHCHVAVFE